jgi:hypothetical protein
MSTRRRNVRMRRHFIFAFSFDLFLHMSAVSSPSASLSYHINWHPIVPSMLTSLFNISVSSILISGTFAFVLSLPLSLLRGIPLDPVALTEALPFLVITVGFNNSRRRSLVSSSIKPSNKSAAKIVREAVDTVGSGVVRDYAIEIAAPACARVRFLDPGF